MYIGICCEEGKRITDEDAFSYALECCLMGPDRDAFEQEFQNHIYGGTWFLQADRFREDLVEWFYSGNWIYRKEEAYA